ncbi:MAG: VCBS repeat-containing protein [Xanthomonadales bacterium]|nr:VCBS repeat-containing protein [Xanthomonadales bacterium]
MIWANTCLLGGSVSVRQAKSCRTGRSAGYPAEPADVGRANERGSTSIGSGLGVASQVEAAVTLPCPTRNNPGVPNDPPCQTGFPSALTELGNDSNLYSSPTIADLDGNGSPEIIFGTQAGRVVAVRSNGTLMWSRSTGSVPVQSKPAVADIDGDGQLEVIVGAGAGNVNGGGIHVIRLHLGSPSVRSPR